MDKVANCKQALRRHFYHAPKFDLNENPFGIARDVITNHPKILDLCRDVPMTSYQLNGGQLKDWKNPFDVDSNEFKEWVYYQKGLSCKDLNSRTFWFDPKWKSKCPYKT